MACGIQEAVRDVARAAQLTLPEARVVVRTLLSGMEKALTGEGRLEIRDFGTFRVRTVRGRVGRLLSRNESLPLPPHRRVFFRPGRRLAPKPRDSARDAEVRPWTVP